MSLTLSSLTIINNGGKYGLQDEQGKVVVPCIYTNILDYDGDGYIRVLQDDVYGTVDLKGNMVIPHSLGLTHLGVFHQGAARARTAEGWGLVNDEGKPLTPFTYRHINAHIKSGGYTAYDADDKKGFLSDSGEFTPLAPDETKKYPKHSKKFKVIGVFHNDIAPALNWKNHWVFVDKYLDQVNDYTYASLDKVLRDGLYSARVITYSPKEEYYTSIYFDGTPFNDDHYDHPLHFENALADCSIEGKYGIVRNDGTYLFPCQYDHLHWNDYDTKDCWFASDDKAAYLLYPSGVRRVYLKQQVKQKWGHQDYIPKSEMPHYISEEELQVLDKQIEIRTEELTEFDAKAFEFRLRKYLGLSLRKPLQFYYRDTDADFDIEALYKRGTIIRAGKNLEATQHIMRPVHRVRFLIASMGLISVEEAMQHQRSEVNVVPPFREYIIHHNAYFLVYDVFTYMGHTQITLLQLPQKAIEVGQEHGFEFGRLEARVGDKRLDDAAHDNFMEKMSEPIHGHSLSDEWTKAMEQPIGLNEEGKLCQVEGYYEDSFMSAIFSNKTDGIIDNEFGLTDYDSYAHWNYSDFSRSIGSIKIIVGNVKQIRTEALVNTDYPANESTDDESQPLYKHLIQTMITVTWQDGKHGESSLLAGWYDYALRRAKELKCQELLIPLLGVGKNNFPPIEAVSIAWHTIKDSLRKRVFTGTVTICCSDMETGEMFKRMH